MTSPSALNDLSRSLAQVGLRILHVGAANVPGTPVDRGSAILVGQVGSELWPSFSLSPECQDGDADAMDRWSRRVISACAPSLAYFNPSDGPPFLPIMALTQGGAYSPSPLGLQVHAEFGLWTAFRGVLFSEDILPASPSLPAPDASVFAGAYGACPGGSLTHEHGLDPFACGKNLLADPNSPCWEGCMARRACSLCKEHQYNSDHARFHAAAYARGVARRLREGLIS